MVAKRFPEQGNYLASVCGFNYNTAAEIMISLYPLGGNIRHEQC